MPTLQESKSLIEDSALHNHSEFILPLLRPAIDIVIFDERAESKSSRFGGIPFMPSGFKWPTHQRGNHRFICQFNLAELPKTELLPRVGMLSFFTACDPDGDDWFWEDEYLYLHYHATTRGLIETTSADIVFGDSYGLEFQASFDLPFNRFLRSDWPWNEDEHDEFEYTLGEEFWTGSADRLLGYAPSSSLAANPTDGRHPNSLLTLISDGDLGWNWHDSGFLMAFVGQPSFKNGAVKAKCTAG